MRIDYRIPIFALAVASAGCNSRHPQLAVDSRSAIALTGGPNTSLIYLARTDSGIIAIDLGWWGYRKPLTDALGRLGASTADVKVVFLTHSHRDHIAAWPEVRRARFFLSEAERSRLFGLEAHRGWMVRLAERINDTDFPTAAAVNVKTFSRDTVFELGRDTLRAYTVPGHTAGSAAYLFRGVLFVGDAVTYSPIGGFKSAKPRFSDDPPAAAANLQLLWSRLPLRDIRSLCTAHAECAVFNAELRRQLGVPERP